ncbi:MAG TPA: hypothetical protein VFZ53_08485 [Polyangiaceae bacterium]
MDFVKGLVPVLLFLSACTVDTPVVEGSKDRLGEDLAAWCDSLCATFVECESEATPEEREGCGEDCVSYFSDTYVGRGEVCESAALRAMDCVEDASCSELADDTCNLHEAEARCAESLGQVVCGAEDISLTPSGGPFQCELGLGDCSDDNEYRLTCEPSEPPECHCSVNGSITGRFTPSVLVCPTIMEVKRICGWPIPNGRGEPELPAPAVCMLRGSTASGLPDDCDIGFDACSDGHSYGIECENAAGEASCRCVVDGAPIGFVGSPGAICPFANDPDGGAVTLNYACSFMLAPPSSVSE